MKKTIFALILIAIESFSFEWGDWSGDVRFRYQLENRVDKITTEDESEKTDSLWKNRYRMRVRFGSSVNISEKMSLFFKVTTNDTTFSEFKYSSQIATERFNVQYSLTEKNRIILGVFDNPFVKSTLVMDSWYGVSGFATINEILFSNFLLELKSGVLLSGSISPEHKESLFDGIKNDYPYLFVGRVDLILKYIFFGVGYFHYTTGDFSIINPTLSISTTKWIPFGVIFDGSFNFSKESNNKGGQVVIFFGENKKGGDFLVSGYYRYIELNGTNPIFTDSDFHDNKTNASGFYINLSYSIDKNWLIQGRGWISEDIKGDFKNRNISIQTTISF